MICPYCNKEMLKGYIYHGKDDLRWTPENERPGFLINFPKDYEIQISKSKRIKRNKKIVYRCQNCKLFIFNEID